MELLEKVEKKTPSVNKEKTTEKLYEETFPGVAKFVRAMGGSFEDAKDIFHDALVIFYENSKDLVIRTSEKSYILGIAKHLWIKRFNKNASEVSINELEREIAIPEDYFPDINNKRLLKFLETAGRHCMDLLHAFYYTKLPLRKIAKSMGYANEHSVSVQKYKCIEKVRDSIKEKSLIYDDFRV